MARENEQPHAEDQEAASEGSKRRDDVPGERSLSIAAAWFREPLGKAVAAFMGFAAVVGVMAAGVTLFGADDSSGDSLPESTRTSTTTTLAEPAATTEPPSTTEPDNSLSSCLHTTIETSTDIPGTATLDGLAHGETLRDDFVDPLVGSWSDLPDGIDVWVLSSPLDTDLLYPQTHKDDSTPADLSPDGRFVSAAYMGESGTFEIVAVLANEEASQFLQSVLAEWASAGTYPGLEIGSLPAGLRETDCRIVVVP